MQLATTEGGSKHVGEAFAPFVLEGFDEEKADSFLLGCGDRTKHAYDALYRLVRNRSVYAVDEPDRPHEQTWAYDYLGNMTDWRDEDAGGDEHFFDRSLGAITNGIDDVPGGSVRPDALVSARLDDDNHLEATYNASGDMESLTVTKAGAATVHDYAWDQVHRLVSAEVDGVRSDFTYDYADQRRIKRTDVDEVLYFSDSYEERDDVPTKWLHIGTQRLLRVSVEEGRTAEVSFYLSNHLGTTSVVIAADSAPRSASTYLPYGALEQEVVTGDEFDPDYRFTGKERDEATGLDYFGARYYAARLGRWVNPDPLVVHASAVGPVANAFAYVEGNPLLLTDPIGLQADPDVDELTDTDGGADVDPAPDAPAGGAEPAAGTQAAADPEPGVSEVVETVLDFTMPSATAPHRRDPAPAHPALRVQRQMNERAQAAGARVSRRLATAALAAQAAVAGALSALAIGGAAAGAAESVAIQVGVRAPAVASGAAVARSALSEVAPATPAARGAATGAARATELLRPGGRLIGRAGSRADIRVVRGGTAQAEGLFQQLGAGGRVVTPPGHPGTLVELPGGGFVGLRPISRSGPPTVDVNLPGITEITKIKFLP